MHSRFHALLEEAQDYDTLRSIRQSLYRVIERVSRRAASTCRMLQVERPQTRHDTAPVP